MYKKKNLYFFNFHKEILILEFLQPKIQRGRSSFILVFQSSIFAYIYLMEDATS